MCILDIIPCADGKVRLPVGSLQGLLVLHTLVLDGGVQIRVVVIQHPGE
jgi:hypothetical protein